MTKITQEKFLEMIKQDQEMAKRLANYLGDTKDEKEIAKKTIEFAKEEGYEIETKQSLGVDDLENVSGGFKPEDLTKWSTSISNVLDDLTNASKKIRNAAKDWGY